MKDFILDIVFSGFGMFIVACAFFVWLIFGLAEADRVKQFTEACYAQGMVLVESDAGQRCADPRTLVKVK